MQQTNNEILDSILNELSLLVNALNKATKQLEKLSPTLAAISGNITARTMSAKDLSSIATAIRSLSSALVVFNKIKSDDIEKISTNFDKLNTAIKKIKLTKTETLNFKNFMDTFSTLNKTFGQLSDNIFDTFKKFNPIKGFLIGRMMGKFYKNLLNGFKKEQLGDAINSIKTLGSKKNGDSINAFSLMITSIFTVDWKNLLAIGQVLKRFPKEAGVNFAAFLLPIINLFGKDFPTGLQESGEYSILKGIENAKTEIKLKNTKLKGLLVLMDALISIPITGILKLATMGKYLDAEKGVNIGNFFHELLSRISKDDIKNLEEIRKFTITINACILASVVSLGLLTMIVDKYGIKTVGIGFGILAALALGEYRLIKLYAKQDFKKNTKDAMYTMLGVSALLLAMTISLSVVTNIVAKHKFEDVILGLGTLGVLTYFSIKTIKKLANAEVKENSKESLISLGIIVLLLGTFTVCLNNLMKSVSTYPAKKVVGAITTLAVLIGFGLGTIRILALDSMQKASKDSIFAAGAIVLLTSVLTLCLNNLMKSVAKHKVGDIALAITSLGLIMTFGVLAVKGLSKISMKSALQAGAAGVVVAGLMFILTSITKNFMEVAKLSKQVTIKDVLFSLGVMIAMVGLVSAVSFAIGTLVFGPLAAIFAAGAGAVAIVGGLIYELSGAMTSFSNLILLVNKSLTKENVKNAKNLITGEDGMSSIIKIMLNELSEVGLWGAIKIKIISGSLTPIFEGLSKFVDVILKMSSGRIVTEYDKDGNPKKYEVISNEKFKNAATVLTNAFVAFIQGIDNIKRSPHLKRVLKTLKKGDLPGLMSSLSSFTDAVLKLASGKIVTEYDKDGNPIKYGIIKNTDFAKAANTLGEAFTTFINSIDKISRAPHLKRVLKALKKGDLPGLMSSLCDFTDAVLKLSEGKLVTINRDKDGKIISYKSVFKNAAATLGDAFTTFINSIDKISRAPHLKRVLNALKKGDLPGLMTSLNAFTDSLIKVSGQDSKKLITASDTVSTVLKNFIDALSKNLNTEKIRNISKFASNLKIITNNVKKLDDILIKNNSNRIKAMNNIAKGFTNISESINKLNNEMSISETLVKNFDALDRQNNIMMFKGLKKVSNAVSLVKEKIADKVEEINNKTSVVSNNNEATPQLDPTVMVNAIINGLDAWSKNLKIININFGNSDTKKLVGMLSTM